MTHTNNHTEQQAESVYSFRTDHMKRVIAFNSSVAKNIAQLKERV